MSSHRHAVLALLLCLGAGSLIGFLEWQRRTTPPPVPAAATRPQISGIAAAVRTLKLVTWQFETTISADSVSDKWYGNAVASVRAPVRYQYGVDLSKLEQSDLMFGAGDGELVFLVPPPERIAVEVDLAKLEQTLKTSGIRWNSHNGDQIDAARNKLAAVAQGLSLPPDEEARLRIASKQQLEDLLGKTLAGQWRRRVSVRFAE